MSGTENNILKLNYNKDEINLIRKVTKMLVEKTKSKHGLNLVYGEIKLNIHERECSFVTVEPKLRLVDMNPEHTYQQKLLNKKRKEQKAINFKRLKRY